MEPFLIAKSSQMNTSCKYSFFRNISSRKESTYFSVRYNPGDKALSESIIYKKSQGSLWFKSKSSV